MNRAELKSLAKQQIKGNIGVLFLISLVVALVSSAANIIPVVGQIASVLVLAPAFALATYKIYLNLTAGVKAEVGHAFNCFGQFWAAFKVQFLVGLFTMLWSILLYIPGIIKAISYSQAMYILAENPEIGALEAINRSKAMMHGHKMDYFVLGLSFIGWAILGMFTFGLLYIWLIPYMNATLANFYNSIKPVEETVTAEPAVEAAAE